MNKELELEYKLSCRNPFVGQIYDWCIQCLRRSKRIHNTRLILSNFLEEGLSSVNRKASLKERYEVMCKYYGKVSTILLHGWFAVRFYFAKWFKGRV